MSLKICCFASGSKGNCTYVSDGETDIVIDLGISATRAEACMRVLGVNPDTVHIFVTHSHSDHVAGLKVFCKKHPQATVHCQSECTLSVMQAAGATPCTDSRNVRLGKLDITALPVPHDVPCFGYVVQSGGESVAVVTDIGAVRDGARERLCWCGLVMIEANHDPELLRQNRTYSYALKRRISSEYGHLSNADCAALCTYLAGRGVKSFILAHLSEDNNNPELAMSEVARSLALAGISGAHITCATQNKMTGLFEVC